MKYFIVLLLVLLLVAGCSGTLEERCRPNWEYLIDAGNDPPEILIQYIQDTDHEPGTIGWRLKKCFSDGWKP